MAKQHHIAMLCLIPFACVACSKRDTVVPQTTQAVDRTVIERKKKQAIFQRTYRHASKDVREAIQPAGIRARKQAQKIIYWREEQQRKKHQLAQCAPSKKQRQILKRKRNKKVEMGFTVKGYVRVGGQNTFHGDLHGWYRLRKKIRGKPSFVYLALFGENKLTKKCGLFWHDKEYQFTGRLRQVKHDPADSTKQRTKRYKPSNSYYILKVESWKELPY